MIKVNSIIIVVVLYKCKIKESKSIITLSDSIKNYNNEQLDLVIYDNCPIYNIDMDLTGLSSFNIKYIPDENNSGVSKAYNTASQIGKDLGKKYILLLDQDTEISQNYFCDLSKIDDIYTLVVPVLKDKGKIISPCKYILGRGSILNYSECKEGIHLLKKRNFLNSGSLISITLFNKLNGYDENIPLYFSDFNFFNRLKKIEKQYYQMNTIFSHEMSSNDENNLDAFKNRFELYCDGARKCYYSRSGKIIMFINVLLRAIKVGIRHRTFDFLKITIKKFMPNLFL